MAISLREVTDSDLPVFFAQMSEPEGIRMAAFTAKDPSDVEAFQAHWARIRHDPAIVARTVVGADGAVLGNVGAFGPPEEREITYWVGREFWGRGVATASVRALLDLVPERPLHARVATDNVASRRVLEKVGFIVTGRDRGFANGRGEEIEELLLELRQ